MQLLCLFTILLIWSGTLDVATADEIGSCDGSPKVFDYQMLYDQFAFISNVSVEFTEEQSQLFNDALKAESTLVSVDNSNPRPALFGYNPYLIDHLIDMKKHYKMSVFYFLTKNYNQSIISMDKAKASANCFKQALDEVIKPSEETTTVRVTTDSVSTVSTNPVTTVKPNPTTPAKDDGTRQSVASFTAICLIGILSKYLGQYLLSI